MKKYWVQAKFEATIEVEASSIKQAKELVQGFMVDEMAEFPVQVPGYDRTEQFILRGGVVVYAGVVDSDGGGGEEITTDREIHDGGDDIYELPFVCTECSCEAKDVVKPIRKKRFPCNQGLFVVHCPFCEVAYIGSDDPSDERGIVHFWGVCPMMGEV